MASILQTLAGHSIRPKICQPIGQDELIIKTPSLKNEHLVSWKELTYQEIKDTLPRDYEQHTSGDPNYKPDGGESWIETQDRVKEALNEIAKNHHNEKILCVTHGGIVSMLLRFCLNIPLNEKENSLFLILV